MNTDKAICLVDEEFVDGDKKVKLERGREYTVSTPKDGMRTVFTHYWFDVPEEYFGGAVKFTRDNP